MCWCYCKHHLNDSYVFGVQSIMRKNAESLLQQQVKTLLMSCGYTVIEVGKTRAKVKCNSCGAWSYPRGWQGNTLGAPDLYIHHKQWHKVALGIELKTEKGAVRERQQELANDNLTTICRSLDDVIVAVMKIDEMFNIDSKLKKVTWIT